MNPQQLFATGGLTLDHAAANSGLLQGPGYGYGGAKDVYHPPVKAPTGGRAPGNLTPTAPATGPSEADLTNQIYDARIGDLNNQANTLGQQQQSIQGDINNQYDTSAGTLKSNLDQTNAGLDLTTQQGAQRHQDALSAARRLYNDLISGGQQRFGGASSAGEAYSALTGRQLQQNDQAITSQHNDFMNQVGLARTNVKSKYDDAVKQLDSQKNLALNQAQRDFQDKMSQINSLKGQAASDKATQQLSALQNLRNTIYSINLQTGQASQVLNDLRSQSESQIQSLTSSIGQNNANVSTAQTGFNQNTAHPTNNLAFGQNPNPTQGGAPQTGQINPAQANNNKDWYDQQVYA